MTKKEELRTCLKCGKKFLSEGVGNRICNACDKKPSRNIDVYNVRSNRAGMAPGEEF
jgi:hypothetical protein